MTYSLSQKADEDIIAVYIEGFRKFGATQAEKYHTELEQTFQLLSRSPKLARERIEITPPVRIHPYRSHIIIYTIDEKNNIFILRIHHGREDWKNNPIE